MFSLAKLCILTGALDHGTLPMSRLAWVFTGCTASALAFSREQDRKFFFRLRLWFFRSMPITLSQPICSGGLAVKYLRPLPCALALILALSSLSLAATQTEFAGAVSYVTGSFPIFVTTADINKDGKMDIIAANNATNNISVLLGNGDGTFQAKIDTPANLAPKSIAVVDFDKDGRLDLVIANAGNEGIVTVLPGRGDGTFKTPVPVTLGGNEISVAAADLNGDGNADIAAVDNSGTGTLWIVLGNGN